MCTHSVVKFLRIIPSVATLSVTCLSNDTVSQNSTVITRFEHAFESVPSRKDALTAQSAFHDDIVDEEKAAEERMAICWQASSFFTWLRDKKEDWLTEFGTTEWDKLPTQRDKDTYLK
eukprot:scaffold119201_cov57-Attheya_sp.AAC.3